MTEEELRAAEDAAKQQIERHRAHIIAIINQFGPLLQGEHPCDACAALASMIAILLHTAFPDRDERINALAGLVRIMLGNVANEKPPSAPGLKWEVGVFEMPSDAKH